MLTRQDYLAGRCSHREYYGDIVDELRTKYEINVRDTFWIDGVREALDYGDEALSFIPVSQWDNMASFWLRLFREPLEVRNAPVSLAACVCIYKEAARQAAA